MPDLRWIKYVPGTAWEMLVGQRAVDDAAKGLGWVLNLAVAEWVIRRAPGRLRRTSPAAAAGAG